LIAPITGQLDSIAAVCIAVAASRPGAMKSRYGTPAGAFCERSTIVPSPTPRAAR